MSIEFLLERFERAPSRAAIVFDDREHTFGWLDDRVRTWRARLADAGVETGMPVAIESDFSSEAVAALLAAIWAGAVVVPLTDSLADKKPVFREIAEVRLSVVPDDDRIDEHEPRTGNDLLARLAATGHPGLVLFSSGSTGQSKAALHDLVPLLRKFETRRRPWRTIPFLLFDHIGGFNTLMYSLANLGCLVVVRDRTPDSVCAAIDRYRVEMLPTSPTFLNLLLVSRAYERHDLSTLRLITYGTEPMPETTLQRLHELFPEVELKQTYGLSEVGILRSRSRSSASLWMQLGGEGYETRVVDGLLEIKAESAMLGYLNAPSPFTSDGWFKTGDAVEVDGDYFRVLGRETEIINVGGEKVYPAEVEGVIQQMDGVVDVAVTGEPHRLVGQIVVARVQLADDEPLRSFRSRCRRHCAAHLEPFKIPQKFEITRDDLHGQRFKKMRRRTP